jgi:hypothetical protein
MKTFFTLVLFATGSLGCYAQTVIKPGYKTIRYDLIKPSHDFYKYAGYDTTGKPTLEFMMEDVTTIDEEKKIITFARSRQVPVGSFSTDTSVTDLMFKPIRMHEIHYQRGVSYEMTFGDTQASVKTNRKGVETVKDYPMENGYFEDNMIEYIFGYLDLKLGIIYTLDNFNKDAPLPSDPYSIEYVFDDTWELAPGHRLDCRVFHFTHGLSKGYIWIDKINNQMLKEEVIYKGIERYVISKL